jgi:hypothetical protein
MDMKILRVGSGAGYSGDRIEPAVELARDGNLDYLVFECLAERTIAIAQQMRLRDPNKGYDPLLVERMEAVLPEALARGVKIITNMGAANPLAAAACVADIAKPIAARLQRSVRIAAVTGDDVLEVVRDGNYRLLESNRTVASLGSQAISANAYLGAAPLVDALSWGADIVIAGRVADSAMFLAPLVHEFGWRDHDWTRLGRGTIVGHLLECAGQVTGGYYDTAGRQDAKALARLGFPLAEVDADGNCTITKVSGSGGEVTVATCTEQLLYEIHDPQHYPVPDVTADLSGVELEQRGADRVAVWGGAGHTAPEQLKVTVGILDGYLAEAEISYAGPGALDRGRLACEIVAERLRMTSGKFEDLRFDLIGADALHGQRLSLQAQSPYEVRVRIAARSLDLRDAERVGREVEALYTNGPAGGAGVRRSVREVLSIESCLVPRQQVRPEVSMREIRP